MTLLTFRELFEQLAQEGLISPQAVTQIRDALSTEFAADSSPWYVRILVGLSAWIAAILFLVSLFGLRVVDSPVGAIVLGAFFTAATILIRRNTQHLFLHQLTFVLNLAGQILCIGGIVSETESLSAAAISLFLLAGMLLSVYPDAVHRFFSVLFMFGAAVALAYDLEMPNAIHLLILLAAVAVFFVWKHESGLLTGNYAEFFAPVGYGVASVLFLMLIPSFLPDIPVSSWWVSTIGLLALLLLVQAHLLALQQIRITHSFGLLLLIGTVLISLPFFAAPGIIAALLVLLLGFQRGNPVLTGLAVIFLAVFLVAFYYHLDLTLLVKSGILLISGIGLLGVRFLCKQFISTGKEL